MSIRKCAVCGIEELLPNRRLHDCSRCKARCYCGRVCQVKDWKELGHKKACKPKPPATAPPPPPSSATKVPPADPALAKKIEEIERLQKEQTPPWWDEIEYPPEYHPDGPTPSALFNEQTQKALRDLQLNGGDPPPSIRHGPEVPGQGHSGMTPAMYAANTLDLPYLKAILRCGSDLNFLPFTQGCRNAGHGTVLLELCRRATSTSHGGAVSGGAPDGPGREALHPGRPMNRRPSLRAMIDFVLSVGADPNLHSGHPQGDGCTPLTHAARAGDLDLARALFGAPVAVTKATAAAAAARARDAKTRKAILKLAKAAERRANVAVDGGGRGGEERPRPEVLCPCGSGRLGRECHMAGVPLHPKQPCLCDGNKGRPQRGKRVKSYRECCMARGVILKERLNGNEGVGQYVDKAWTVTLTDTQAKLAAGIERGRPICRNGEDVDTLAQQRKMMYARVGARLGRLKGCGGCDPAFIMSAIGCDFGHPMPWRGEQTVGLNLDKTEMLVREAEWNARVDAYIAEGLDGSQRSAVEIEKGAKIDWRGGPLYARCGHCAAVEPSLGLFKACGKCKVVKFCGAACSAKAWKARHKRECGTAAAEPRLESEVVLTEALTEDMEAVAQIITAADEQGTAAAATVDLSKATIDRAVERNRESEKEREFK